jgi:hypothetical protein
MFNKTKFITNKPYITIKDQDIIDLAINRTSTANIIIPHVCNNVNSFGGGFAGYISNKLPHVKENFHLLGNKSKLGYTQFIDAYINKHTNNKVIIANMIAQNGLISKSNSRPLNYHALCICMSNIRKYITDLNNKDISTPAEIYCPKFGSGLAGGNWQFITEIINDIWTNTPVFVFIK